MATDAAREPALAQRELRALQLAHSALIRLDPRLGQFDRVLHFFAFLHHGGLESPCAASLGLHIFGKEGTVRITGRCPPCRCKEGNA